MFIILNKILSGIMTDLLKCIFILVLLSEQLLLQHLFFLIIVLGILLFAVSPLKVTTLIIALILTFLILNEVLRFDI
jgi:hypothetical protein